MSLQPDTYATPTLIACGVLSAPEFLDRRTSLRESWVRSPLVGPGRPIGVQFVIRARNAPKSVSRLLSAEHQLHGDVLRIDVPWNETRLRGPVLSVYAWLGHATRAHRTAPFVAKLDDDVWLHAPGIESALRLALASVPDPRRIYLGVMSYFHWYPAIFERSGYGYRYSEAYEMGRGCRNLSLAEARCQHRGCGACVGPFPFPAGFLIVYSTPLAAELHASSIMRSDVSRLRSLERLPTRAGREQVKVMEDVWLGSLWYRSPPKQPIAYVGLADTGNPTLSSDFYGLRSTRGSLIVHIKGKQLERFLAVDAWRNARNCTPSLALDCQARGCDTFISPWEMSKMQRQMRLRLGDWWRPALGRSPFCAAAGGAAGRYCRVRPLREGCCRAGRCEKLIDLMGQGLPQAMLPRARALLQGNQAMQEEVIDALSAASGTVERSRPSS